MKRPEDTLISTRTNAQLTIPVPVAASLMVGASGHAAPPGETSTSVIVQATEAASATRLVGSVGGTVTLELGIIRAAGARPAAAQRDRLAGLQGVLHLFDASRLDDDSQSTGTIR